MPTYNSTNPKPLPPAEYLRERLDYSPETGELRWKNGNRAGKLTGTSISRGYCTINVSGAYQTHRIIWKWMTGEDPSATIDHIDGDKSNNRWSNLRAATKLEQQHNRRMLKPNTAGQQGVYPSSKNRWIARIRINHARVYLGCFSTIEKAVAAYEDAARKNHGKFYRGD